MIDFASAAMVRVLAQGLRALGLQVPDMPAPTEARVGLDVKRALVAHAVAQGGVACLPQLGQGLHRLQHEPTHHALCAARGARDLFERWQRLERYVHSRHRCVLLHVREHADGAPREAGEAGVRHVALAGAAPPRPEEDLVVLGVLAALLEAIGLQQVQVALGDASSPVMVYPHAEPEALRKVIAAGVTASWHFRWVGPPAGRDAAGGPAPAAGPAALGADVAWPDLVQRVYRLLAGDLTRPCTVQALASGLGMAPRTLQRELARSGHTSSQLLAEARCRAGAWRLLHTDLPVAEIGFLCCYADQPHFTRELQRRVGLAPAAYRRAFAVGHGERA